MSYGGGGYRDYPNRNNYHNQNNRGWRDNNNNNNNHNNNNNNNSYYGGGNRYQHQQQNSQYYSRNQNNYHNNNYNNNRYSNNNNNNNNNSNQNQRWNNTHNENNNYEFQTKSYQNKSGSPGKQGQQYQTTQSGAAAAAAAAAAAVATTPVEAAPAKAKSPSQENDKNKSKNKWSASASSSSEEELDARHDFWDEEEEDVNVYHLIYFDEDYERAQDITMDLLENSEDGELTDKDESTLRCYLGTVYTRGYEYHYEAKEEFEKAIKLDDENDLAYYEYGDMLYELGQYTQALKYFEKACELKPNNSLYKDGYNEARDEIERDGLQDAPMPQELLEPCAPADGEDDGFVDDREDYEREENDDANDTNDGKAQGSKGTKNTEQAQGYNNKKLGSMPEDKEANVGYEDNEEEYDDDDEYGDEDEYSSEFERFWESFSQWDNEDEDYYYAFEEHGLDDIRILVNHKLNDDFEKRVLNDQIGMSKEHSGYFMKRLMQLQKDNGDFKSWLQSIQLFDEYYTNVFEDNEIVTFNAFYYWIQSKDDLLDYIASDTIDENSTDFKLLWETNPRYVRNHPNDKDGVLLCSACQKKINENAQNFQESDNGNNNDNAPTKQNGK